MKAGLLGSIVGAVIGIASVWSCTINRPSESLKCDEQSDCITGTICDLQAGYCVRGQLIIDARPLDAYVFVCPAVCDSCDESKTPIECNITGTGTGNITCPMDLKCNITCGQAGACGQITCGSAASCDIDCLATNSCLGISCQTKNCDVTCTGSSACQNIQCTTGTCTANCTGDDACEDISCTSGTCSAMCAGSAACGNMRCEDMGTCTETCGTGSGSAACGNLTCTGTGKCTRTCDGIDACGNMQCSDGECTETCSGGSNACGTLNCGNGKCLATCQGLDPACGNVQCSNSCQCDVMCDGATNDCPATYSCPDPNGMPPDACEDLIVGRCNSAKTPNKCQVCP